jgi:hypothetical protein
MIQINMRFTMRKCRQNPAMYAANATEAVNGGNLFRHPALQQLKIVASNATLYLR